MRGYGPFDLWVYEHDLVVEVDGEQHNQASFGATSAEEQMARDRAKERAAVQSGYHVVRLHHADQHTWQCVLSVAMGAAMARRTAQVHYTPRCPTPALSLAPPAPTCQTRSAV